MTNTSFQDEPPLLAKETLPTMYYLPSEEANEPGLPEEFQKFQARLLHQTFQPHKWYPDKLFCANNLNLYYDFKHLNWYKKPD